MKEFNKFIKSLNISLRKLPGFEAQLKMAPITRLSDLKKYPVGKSPRKSAVLILLYPDKGEIKTVLMERAADNTVHSSQISFPGGKFENGDNNLQQTALREANEEIGIAPETVKILGPLTKLYIPPSNFDVFPFVGYTNEKPVFKTNSEVKSILEVDLKTLMNPNTLINKTIEHRTGGIFTVPCYFVQEHIIWGATSMIISELLEVVSLSENNL